MNDAFKDQFVFNEVVSNAYVYTANISRFKQHLLEFYTCLSFEEKIRAGKYHYDFLRDRYVIAHGILRYILGFYIKTTPKDIVFNYNMYGKPSLPAGNGIQFNMSYSQELVC